MPTEKRTLVLDSNGTSVLEDFHITVNDSFPSLEYTLSRTGSSVPNLTDWTANLKVRGVASTSNLFSIAVTSSGGDDGQITSTSSGVIKFDWSTGSWSSTGTFIGEISLTSSGQTETIHDRQAFIVESEF